MFAAIIRTRRAADAKRIKIAKQAFASVILTMPLSVQADTAYWDVSLGDFDTVANWSTCPLGDCDPLAVPGAADFAHFELLDSTINFSAVTTTNNSVYVRGTNTTFNLNTGAYELIGGDLRVGESSLHNSNTISTLNLRNGQFNIESSEGFAYIGAESGHTGELNLYDNASARIWNTHLGEVAGATGNLSLDGAGTSLTTRELRVGNAGTGSVTISNGAHLNEWEAGYFQSAYLGYSAGSAGAVTVTGSGSLWTSNSIKVGNNGEGTLEILNAGTIDTTRLYVGFNAGSTGNVTIDGADSRLSNMSQGTSFGTLLRIGEAGVGSMTVSGGAEVAGATTLGRYAGSHGTLTLDGAGTLLAADGDVVIGDEGSGILNINNGAKLNPLTYTCYTPHLPDQTPCPGFYDPCEPYSPCDPVPETVTVDVDVRIGSLGEAKVAGTGSELWAKGTIDVAGELRVSNGGRVVSSIPYSGRSSLGVSGSVTVTGAGSSLEVAGNAGVSSSSGVAQLSVLNGATVVTDGVATIGRYIYPDTSIGRVTVAGGGASWTAGEIRIEGSGSRVTVNDGGSLITGFMRNTNDGRLNHNGGRIDITNYQALVPNTRARALDVYVGGTPSADNRMYIAESATVARNTVIDDTSTTETNFRARSLHIDGTNKRWTTESITVGTQGYGEVNIENGGLLFTRWLHLGSADRNQYIGLNTGSSGVVNVDGAGSWWDADAGSVYIGGSQTAAGGAGTLNITDGGKVTVSGDIKLWDNGTVNLQSGMLEASTIDSSVGIFDFTGGTLMADAFIGDLVNVGGTVGPGHSPGILSVSGDYSQDSLSTLLIEITGLTAGTQYDVLDVAGSASINGLLLIDLQDGFVASEGDYFDILLADSIDGTFSGIQSLDMLSAGLVWKLDYNIDLAGDDYLRLRVATVPIPGAVWLMGSGLLGLVGFARRKRRKLQF